MTYFDSPPEMLRGFEALKPRTLKITAQSCAAKNTRQFQAQTHFAHDYAQQGGPRHPRGNPLPNPRTVRGFVSP
jgi:hypothetical protein